MLSRSITAPEPSILAKPYEGSFQLLDILKEKGLKLAVATYKPQPLVDLLAQRFQLFRWMDAVCGADGTARTKALIIEKALKQGGSLPGEAVMIGDTRQDKVGPWRPERTSLG